ncbi:MAG: hypothetical protein LBG60_09100 [Bifidobacteriaceae bacterium]|nr:hypothetical protein [Bifidobacteriaceae bacterium]
MGGRFAALAEGVPAEDLQAAGQTARRASGRLFGLSPADALTALSGPVGRYVMNAGRRAVARNAARDPAAQGWRRVVRADGCDFCRMLADRGGVYKRDTVDFASHNDCRCQAEPAWGKGGREVDVRVYEASERTSRMSEAQREAHNRRTREWMERNGYADSPRLGVGGSGRKPPDPPGILMGGAEDWPDGLQPVSGERFAHILREHGPDASGAKSRFHSDTDVGQAAFDTVAHGRVAWESARGKAWRLVVNGQEVEVVARFNPQGRLFVVTAYPVE